MSSDALSEESSVRERAGYDETFGSSDEFEDFSPSLERKTSAQSPDDKDEGYIEGSEEVGKEGSGGDGGDDGDEKDGDGDEEDGDGESCEGTLVGPGDN